MEFIINILKVILLGLVIAFVAFHLGKFINDIQVKKFKEESEDKIILPEKDMCDSCINLEFKNTEEGSKIDNAPIYQCLRFGGFNCTPERCMFYCPSNRVKQSDITQVNISNYPEINIEDDMFDIRPLLESATNVCKAAYWKDTSNRYISECSECKRHHYRRSMWCPNCHSFMSNNED